MARNDLYDVLQEMRRAAEDLKDRPKRCEEAESHMTRLEYVLIHGPVKGNPNHNATAVIWQRVRLPREVRRRCGLGPS